MWAGSAESGPRAGHGGGRWSLRVPSKCFEKNATGHRNPSKVTERSLNITFCLIFRGNNTNASYCVEIGCINTSKLDALTLMHQKTRHHMVLIFMNSDYFVCWG